MIETHVSRPIRSASASGPIGCANPSFAIVSIASASATPSMSAYAASFTNGMRMRFETKPGKSCASAGVLPRSSASAMIAAAVSSDVSRARITSTSYSTGTGLKKCIPMTWSGRDVTAASDVIGIDDVFDARIASGRHTASARRKIVLLHDRVLDDRLDHQIRGDDLFGVGHTAEHVVRVPLSLLGEPREALLASRPAPARPPRSLVVQGDAPPGRRHDLGNAAAHLPGADHEDVLELRARGVSRLGRVRPEVGAGSPLSRRRAQSSTSARMTIPTPT